MARNRKKYDSPLIVGSWIRAVLLCLLLGGTAMGYVWQKSQIHQIGTEVRKKEMRLELLKGDNEGWQQVRAEMRSTLNLYDRVRKLGLGLAMPQVRHRKMRVAMTHPLSDRFEIVGSPLKLSDTPPVYEHPPPLLGEHTEQVLRDLLHYDEDRIQVLRQEHAI